MPIGVRPYLYLMRLDRPIGTWLLLLPGWWAILLAQGLSAWPFLLLFAIGAIIMRGAGCVVNDLWDRNLDGKVERTQARPLVSGQVTLWQAFLLLFGLLMLGLAVLLQLNRLTILVGIASLAFVAIYPLMKRWTWWPQAFLGLTFNFGAIMGWSAVMGEVTLAPILLYISGFFWTMGYDTIYALQDRDDDVMIGIKSTARLFTERWKNIRTPLYVFYALHAILMLAAVYMTYISIPLWAWGLFICAFTHLVWQVKTLDPAGRANALTRFKSNRDYGLLICGIIIILNYII